MLTTTGVARGHRRLPSADGQGDRGDGTSPERELWLNVILVAVRDAGSGPVPPYLKGKGLHNERRGELIEARAFLLDTSGYWCEAREQACDLAGVNPHYLRRIALARIGPENARSQQPATVATAPRAADGPIEPRAAARAPVLGKKASKALPAITAALAALGRPAGAGELAERIGWPRQAVGLILKHAHERGAGRLVRLPNPRGEFAGPPLWALAGRAAPAAGDAGPAFGGPVTRAGLAPIVGELAALARPATAAELAARIPAGVSAGSVGQILRRALAAGDGRLVRIPARRSSDPPSWALASNNDAPAPAPSPVSTAMAA